MSWFCSKNFIVIFSFILCIVFVVSNQEPPRIKLHQGEIQGYYRKSYDGKTFTAFEGIPFAEPPIGNLRFKAPQPAKKWEGLLIANRTSKCSQTVKKIYSGSEDCLHLNVYVPQSKINPKDSYDIAFLIHGGAFQKESAISGASPEYLMDRKLIVVTTNYRLASLGFLSTEDDVVPGNNGLKDQNMAIKWVKENIEFFGGNSDSITLVGFSMGGASVHYHYLSGMSSGLFKRGCSLSGTALNPRSLDKKPLDKAKTLAKSLDCPINNTSDMIKCLSEKTPQQLTDTKIEFRPVVEKISPNKIGFLIDHPYKLIKEGKIIDVPWINTNTISEAHFLIDDIYKERKALKVVENWVEDGVGLLVLDETVSKSEMNDTLLAIKKQYFGDGNLTEEEALLKLGEVMTDRHFLVGSDLVLRSQTVVMKSPIYFMLTSYIPEDYIQYAGKPGESSHGSDAKLLFNYDTNPRKLKPKDEKLMHLMTKFLETYASTGIPKLGDEEWLPIDPNKHDLNVLNLVSPDHIKMGIKEELVNRSFWNSLAINENEKLFRPDVK